MLDEDSDLSALVSLMPEFMPSSTLLKNAVYTDLYLTPFHGFSYLNINDSYICIFDLDKILSYVEYHMTISKKHI